MSGVELVEYTMFIRTRASLFIVVCALLDPCLLRFATAAPDTREKQTSRQRGPVHKELSPAKKTRTCTV